MRSAKWMEGLSGDTIDEKSRDYDWTNGWGERWEHYAADECQQESCKGGIIVGGRTCDKCDIDPHDYPEGPMMNYYYRLPRFANRHLDVNDAARALVDLPVCLVYFNESEEYGLALTGGGMDLSWEICAAHIAVGYMPPAVFADGLPRLAGLRRTRERSRTMAACVESLRVQYRRACYAFSNGKRNIAEIRKAMRGANA